MGIYIAYQKVEFCASRVFNTMWEERLWSISNLFIPNTARWSWGDAVECSKTSNPPTTQCMKYSWRSYQIKTAWPANTPPPCSTGWPPMSAWTEYETRKSTLWTNTCISCRTHLFSRIRNRKLQPKTCWDISWRKKRQPPENRGHVFCQRDDHKRDCRDDGALHLRCP